MLSNEWTFKEHNTELHNIDIGSRLVISKYLIQIDNEKISYAIKNKKTWSNIVKLYKKEFVYYIEQLFTMKNNDIV